MQEQMERMAPVLRTLPPGTQVGFIQDGDDLLLYNITKAFELVVGRQPTAMIDVAQRARLIRPRTEGPPSGDEAQVDPEHAATVDLSYPVMVLEGRDELDGTKGRVIDGWHRIYRAAQLGIPQLPAYVIPADEERLIRIDPNPSSP